MFCEGVLDKLNKTLESVKFIDNSDCILLNCDKKLLRNKSEMPMSESFRSSFNASSVRDAKSFVTQSVHLARNSFSLNKQFSRSQLTTLNQRIHAKLPPLIQVNKPTVKIVMESIPINSLKHLPNDPLLITKRSSTSTILRQIETYQLRNPELVSPRFDISDLLKTNSDKRNNALMEWVRICRVLDKHRMNLRQLFIGYNLAYLQNTLKLEFRPDCLHLERITRINYVVYKKLCQDMEIELDEYILMKCFYLSSRQIKELPSTFNA
jgi:hypothetical protein